MTITLDGTLGITSPAPSVLQGSTSGSVTLTVPAVAGSNTITLPAGTGTAAVQGVSTNIVSGTAVASTSGTSIDFTGIPSYAKRITVMFSGVSTNGTSPPQLQIGSGSVTTSGYLGQNSILTSAPITTTFTTGFGIGVNSSNWAAFVVVNGAITLKLLSGNTWVADGILGRSDASGSYFTAGSIALSGTLDRVRITTVNGTDTFDAGSINILYE